MTQNLDMESIRHVHFVGIGGSGMSGIAEVLANQGYQVSGSDLVENVVTQHLRSLGVQINIGHNETNIIGADIIVVSTAVPGHNSEVAAAQQAAIPVIQRAKMLSALMQTRYGIAISGTHGKTTTTSLIASVLAEGELDPTFVIGGLLKSVGANAQLGTGLYFVAEADESDASFLYLRPKIAVVTNIDADHLNTYNGDMGLLRRSFLDFVNNVPADGLVVLCADDPLAYGLLSEVTAPVVTYGFHEEADIQLRDFQQIGLQSHFRVINKLENREDNITLNLAGKHNASNALATIAVACKLAVAMEAVQNAFEKFLGVGRRFQMYDEVATAAGKVTLIDDYGHHPREIAVTLEAIRLVWPNRRLVMAYQPHRYTRTQALMNDFATVLSAPDVLLLLDVYPAGESPIAGADGESLCLAIAQQGKIQPVFIPKIEELPLAIQKVVQEGDIVLLQGAGSIGSMAARIVTMGIVAQNSNVGA
jgi:UDP-N-acetylmuramate--alanine ligase